MKISANHMEYVQHGVPWGSMESCESHGDFMFQMVWKSGRATPTFPMEKSCGKTANHMEHSGRGQRAAAWKNHVEQRPTTWNIREEASGQQHGKIMWNNGQPHGLNMPGQNLI